MPPKTKKERPTHLKGDVLRRHKKDIELTACGLVLDGKGMKATDDPGHCTCGGCKNTSYYRVLMEGADDTA